MKATVATDSTAIFRMVKVGRVDLGLMLTSDALEFASKNSGIDVLEPPVEVITLYHYVNVKYRRLVPSIEKILIDLNDSGRAKELLSNPN